MLELVGAAGRRLPEADPDARVFVEDRLSVAVEIPPGGVARTTATRTIGAAVDGPVAIHLTDPTPGNLAQIARGAAAPTEGLEGSAGPSLSAFLPLPEFSVAGLEATAALMTHPQVRVRASASVQVIWVAGIEGVAQTEARRSGRIEVLARARSGNPGRQAAATADWVLGSHESPPSGLLERVIARAEARTKAIPVPNPANPGPAVFAPGIAGVIAHELVGHASEGLSDREGTRLRALDRPVGTRELRVVDDPSLGRAPWSIDDEGTPVQPVTLFEGAQATGRLLDLRSARALATESTGHGRRASYLDAVIPRMGCTLIERGSSDPDAILRETRRGLYIRRVESGHVDSHTGSASFLVTDADLIESGCITSPLQAFVISLDLVDLLRSIDRIGSDFEMDTCIGACVREGQAMAVSVGAPTVRIGLIKVRV